MHGNPLHCYSSNSLEAWILFIELEKLFKHFYPVGYPFLNAFCGKEYNFCLTVTLKLKLSYKIILAGSEFDL